MMDSENTLTIFSTLDPERLKKAMIHEDMDACQLSSSPLLSEVGRFMCPQICMNYGSFGPAMSFCAITPKDCYTMVFILACPQEGHAFMWGLTHHTEYMAFFPPGSELDAHTPEGYQMISITIPSDVFHGVLERSYPDIRERDIAKSGVLRLDPELRYHHRDIFSQLISQLRNPDPFFTSVKSGQCIEKMLLDLFLTAFQQGCGHARPQPTGRMVQRVKRLKQARDYIYDHMKEPIHLEHLCQELSMSKRGIEVMFKNSLGISPMAFLRHQRLHAVHRALQESSSEAGSVKSVALNYGFWHLSHFAGDYHKLFGELPKNTLDRAC